MIERKATIGAVGLNALAYTIRSLYILQPRGEYQTSIVTSNPNTGTLAFNQDVGLVSHVHSADRISEYLPDQTFIAAGRNRHRPLLSKNKPALLSGPDNGLTVLVQGNIRPQPYFESLSELLGRGASFQDALIDNQEPFMDRPGYSLIVLYKNQMAAIMDKYATKPLFLGTDGIDIVVSPETNVLDQLALTRQRTLQPGEIAIMDQDSPSLGVKSIQLEAGPPKLDPIEILISDPNSRFLDKTVQTHNVNRGIVAAQAFKDFGRYPECITPIPNGGNPIAEGFQREARVPIVRGLHRNKYASLVHSAERIGGRADYMTFYSMPGIFTGRQVGIVDAYLDTGETLAEAAWRVRAGGGAKSTGGIIGAPLPLEYDFGDSLDPNKLLDRLGVDWLYTLSFADLARSLGREPQELYNSSFHWRSFYITKSNSGKTPEEALKAFTVTR